jgi:AcrR family transcriptional regulator
MFTFQCTVKNRPLEEQQVPPCTLADKPRDFVQYFSCWKGDLALHEEHVKDRRIEKTKNLLHEALGSLIREKPYEEIVVQEILDRANVGRSTFYMHFSDKDALLVSGIHDVLRSVYPTDCPSSEKRQERLIRFSLPIFEHIHRHRHKGSAQMGPRGRAVIHEHLQKVLAEVVANDMKKGLQSKRKLTGQIPTDLLAQYVASTFILVLNWWVETRNPLPPKDINNLFRALILPALAKWE